MNIVNSRTLLLLVLVLICLRPTSLSATGITDSTKKETRQLIVVNIDEDLQHSSNMLVNYVLSNYDSQVSESLVIKCYIKENDVSSKKIVTNIVRKLIDQGIEESTIKLIEANTELDNSYFTLNMVQDKEVQ